MYMIVDSLIDINNIITSSNNIILKKVNVKPYGCDNMYLDKNLREDKMYDLIDQFIEIKINDRKFYFASLDNIHLFYDENGRTCKILFYLQLRLCFIKKRW